MELSDYRARIDEIDSQLVSLFQERMDAAAKIADWKKENGMQVYDPVREREKLLDISGKVPPELRQNVLSLYSLLFDMSRSLQNRRIGRVSPLPGQITEAIENTPRLFPDTASVACQGGTGSGSEAACERLFSLPNILFFSTFEAVFSAIDGGLCRYGVVPLENSTAGSVNAVYDLMMRHNFRIVRSVRLKVDHCLLARPGAKLSEIREICSHSQDVDQCASFLAGLPGVRVIPCENAAAAAKMAAESGRTDVAALSTRNCMKLYSLECLAPAVQDNENSFTRYICIAKKPEIFPGADRTSLMAVLPHEPGSLYKLLGRFYALGINLNKLESRPLPERNFEFMFYFDLETSVYSPEFLQLMGELGNYCEEFSYLGSYSEVV